MDDDRTPAARVRAGSCLCGALRYRIVGPVRSVIDCHCTRCRKWTGHHVAATSARIEDIQLVASDELTWFHPDDDPDVAYGFCAGCGSSAFWTHTGLTTWSVCAGLLDDDDGLVTSAQWWISTAGSYVHLDPSIPSFETQPGPSAAAQATT